MTRTALVTGGTRGIGAAVSYALKEAGYSVVANYAGNEEAAKAFSDENGIPTYRFDVSNGTACAEIIGQIEAEHGGIDILVNNAGILRDVMFHRMDAEAWSSVMRTNLDSMFHVTRCVIEGMRERRFGRIVNLSSINAQQGQMGQTNYVASKAGIIGFTRALALESASRGITVNALAPGYIATEMVSAMPQDILESKILPLIPVGRLGEPEDVARIVVFLASDEAGFITGSVLSANGGQHIGG